MEDLGPPAGQMGRRMTEALGQSHRDQVWAGASEPRCPGRTWTFSVGGRGPMHQELLKRPSWEPLGQVS